jgi:molybdate transport system substrate-binding protein
LKILAAGAAHAVMQGLTGKFQRAHGVAIQADFGAVGAIKARVMAGEQADAIILTAGLIDDLIDSGKVVRGSRADLGQVGTAVAVRAGGSCPDVSTQRTFKANLLGASRIICPDPAVATAGKVFLLSLAELGIFDAVSAKLEYVSSGAAAMESLMAGKAPLELAVVQATEAIACEGAVMAGLLPPGLQRVAMYSIGLTAAAKRVAVAQQFIADLHDEEARAMLAAAGFDLPGGN